MVPSHTVIKFNLFCSFNLEVLQTIKREMFENGLPVLDMTALGCDKFKIAGELPSYKEGQLLVSSLKLHIYTSLKRCCKHYQREVVSIHQG